MPLFVYCTTLKLTSKMQTQTGASPGVTGICSDWKITDWNVADYNRDDAVNEK